VAIKQANEMIPRGNAFGVLIRLVLLDHAVKEMSRKKADNLRE
jgi:hypothetical protein